jgi:hypothetical protein
LQDIDVISGEQFARELQSLLGGRKSRFQIDRLLNVSDDTSSWNGDCMRAFVHEDLESDRVSGSCGRDNVVLSAKALRHLPDEVGFLVTDMIGASVPAWIHRGSTVQAECMLASFTFHEVATFHTLERLAAVGTVPDFGRHFSLCFFQRKSLHVTTSHFRNEVISPIEFRAIDRAKNLSARH